MSFSMIKLGEKIRMGKNYLKKAIKKEKNSFSKNFLCYRKSCQKSSESLGRKTMSEWPKTV